MKPKRIKRSLVEKELPPRMFRHGKEVIEPGPNIDPSTVNRPKTKILVADGPTLQKGKLNIPEPHGTTRAEIVRIYEEMKTPTWWKTEK